MPDLPQAPALPEHLGKAVAAAWDGREWVLKRLDGVEIKQEHSVLVPGLFYDLAIEHHFSIIQLVSSRLFASAFALARAEFEALVRAGWMHRRASAEDVTSFAEKGIWPKITFGEMVAAIEEHEDFADKFLSTLKTSTWKAMNDFTHGGLRQISNRWKQDADGTRTIEPDFDPDQVVELIRVAGTLSLIALRQIGELAGKKDLVDEVNQMLTGASNPSDGSQAIRAARKAGGASAL